MSTLTFSSLLAFGLDFAKDNPRGSGLVFYSVLKTETGLPATNAFTHAHSRTASVPIIPHDAISGFSFSHLCGIWVGDRPLED
jgi:hypothetical protein